MITSKYNEKCKKIKKNTHFYTTEALGVGDHVGIHMLIFVFPVH